jgi:tetratricopeptide (TPR) repeat protein
MIGTRLRRLRVANGLTQRELAAPKYTHAYVSTIEAGRRRPSRRAAEHFAKKLGVDADEILTGRPRDLVPRLELRLQEARVAVSDGRFEEADKAFTAIEKEAKRYKLSRLEARAVEGRGVWFERQGKPEEALKHLQRAEELLHLEPPTARVDAVAGAARCFEALGDIRYAIHILESLLDEIERGKLHDPDALARLHASLVYAYLEAGLYARAAESAAELDHLAPKLTDHSRAAQMHMHVARLYLVQGKIEDALRSLQRAEDAYRQLNLRTETGGAHLARGYVLGRDGQLEEARGQLEQAVAIFEATSNDKDLVRALNELARVERLQGNAGGARLLLEQSIGLMGDSDMPILAWAHRELGLTLLEGNTAGAEKHFRIAIEIYERSEQTADIAVTYRALGDLLCAQGDREAGYEAYRTGILALEPHL